MGFEIFLKAEASRFHTNIFHVDETDSTMRLAREALGGGVPHGWAVAAGYQSHGRGRLPQRQWLSAKDENLLVSFVFHLEQIRLPLAQFSLGIGIALSMMLEETAQLQAEVKWPNDVLCANRKIAGILCERTGDCLIAGIGLNVNQRRFPDDIADTVSSMVNLTRKSFDTRRVLASLTQKIADVLEQGSVVPDLNARLYGKHREAVFVLPDSARLVGQVHSVSEDGALLMQTASGLEKLYSGELTLS